LSTNTEVKGPQDYSYYRKVFAGENQKYVMKELKTQLKNLKEKGTQEF